MGSFSLFFPKWYRFLGLLLIALFPSIGLIVEHSSSAMWYLIALLGLLSLWPGRKQWQEVLSERSVLIALLLIALYVVTMLANIAFIDHSEFAMSRMQRQLLLLGIPLCLVFMAVLRPSVSFLLHSFVLGAIVLGVYSIWFNITGQGARIRGVAHAVYFGNTGLLLAVLSLLPLLYEKRRPTWLWCWCVAGVILGGLTSLWSASRGGWVALPPLAVLVLLIYGFRRRCLGKTLLIGGLGLVLILALLAQTEAVEKRWAQTVRDFQKQESGYRYTSIGMRFIMWKTSFEVFKEAPILGQGFSGFGDGLKEGVEEGRYKERMYGFRSDPHNQYLFEASAKGLVGLGVYLALIGAPLAMLVRPAIYGNRQALAVALAGILTLTFYSIYGLTITIIDERRMVQLFGFLYAVIIYLAWKEIFSMRNQ